MRSARYPTGGRTIREHVFVISRPKSKLTGVAIHDLADLYNPATTSR
ncbi:MAG: hypothetical protein KIT84_24145 [Labilithrix sp.]|nr:hypothetical protein [Labilithrix sp.]MCW5814142.1 hypothetical protein [Labilithrix sp.]